MTKQISNTMDRWEKIAAATKDDQPYNVWRFPVPGGWIYVHANYGVSGSVFVPAIANATS